MIIDDPYIHRFSVGSQPLGPEMETLMDSSDDHWLGCNFSERRLTISFGGTLSGDSEVVVVCPSGEEFWVSVVIVSNAVLTSHKIVHLP